MIRSAVNGFAGMGWIPSVSGGEKCGSGALGCVHWVKSAFARHASRDLRIQMKLLVGLTVPALSQAAGLAAGSSKIVMVTGDHAPDGNGVFASIGLTVGGINDAGQVAFAAQLVGTAQGTRDNSGLFRGDGAALIQIARAGQPFGPGGEFSFFGVPALNEPGQVAFAAFLQATDGGGVTGVFRGAGTPGSLTQIVRQGESVPSGNGEFGIVFSAPAPPTLNAAGQVAFHTLIANATNQQTTGLFRGNGSSITPIAVFNTPAPGGNSFGALSAGPVMNDMGYLAFGTTLFDLRNPVFGSAVAVSDGSTASMYARPGQSTPDGTGTFNTSVAVFLNDSGQVAFVTSVNGLTGSRSSIYVADGASLTEISRTGDAAFGLAGQPLAQYEWLYLNNTDQVAFTAITCCNSGIFRWDPATKVYTNLVVKGQATPDGSGVISLLYSSYLSPVELNDSGQIAFGSIVTGGSLFNDFGIFFYDDRLGLLHVARLGDALLGSTITKLSLATGASKANTASSAAGRPFSPLNNHGQVAYSFVLADGRSGVAVWTPSPLPQLRLTGIQIGGHEVDLAWTAPGGSTNVVQASSSVSGGYADISGNISSAGTGQVTNTFSEIGGATNGLTRFYRVRQVP